MWSCWCCCSSEAFVPWESHTIRLITFGMHNLFDFILLPLGCYCFCQGCAYSPCVCVCLWRKLICTLTCYCFVLLYLATLHFFISFLSSILSVKYVSVQCDHLIVLECHTIDLLPCIVLCWVLIVFFAGACLGLHVGDCLQAYMCLSACEWVYLYVSILLLCPL